MSGGRSLPESLFDKPSNKGQMSNILSGWDTPHPALGLFPQKCPAVLWDVLPEGMCSMTVWKRSVEGQREEHLMTY